MLKLQVQPPCEIAAIYLAVTGTNTEEMVTEDGWFFQAREECRLTDKVRTVRRVEQNVTRLKQESVDVAVVPWYAPPLAQLEPALGCDVIHPNLERAILNIFAASKPRRGVTQQLTERGLGPSAHPSIPSSSFMACLNSSSSFASSARISFGGRCSTAWCTTSL